LIWFLYVRWPGERLEKVTFAFVCMQPGCTLPGGGAAVTQSSFRGRKKGAEAMEFPPFQSHHHQSLAQTAPEGSAINTASPPALPTPPSTAPQLLFGNPPGTISPSEAPAQGSKGAHQG